MGKETKADFPVIAENTLADIFTTESLVKILAASTCMIDLFCKSMAATIYCDDRKSAFMFLFGAENRKANDSMSNAGSGV